ncbi:hypothetical protein L1887_53433 [Cichorium endivia]|nr:hypothetical protein L1887_53433 [Cichorium endivia]
MVVCKGFYPPLDGNCTSWRARTTHPSHGLGQRHVPLGAEAPTAGRQTGGGAQRVASSPDSDLEAFSHNPAHGSFAPLAFQPAR